MDIPFGGAQGTQEQAPERDARGLDDRALQAAMPAQPADVSLVPRAQ
jgi:hypothetical protein